MRNTCGSVGSMGSYVDDENRRVLKPVVDVGRVDWRKGLGRGGGMEGGRRGDWWMRGQETSSDNIGRVVESVCNSPSKVIDIVRGREGDGVSGRVSSAEKVHLQHESSLNFGGYIILRVTSCTF